MTLTQKQIMMKETQQGQSKSHALTFKMCFHQTKAADIISTCRATGSGLHVGGESGVDGRWGPVAHNGRTRKQRALSDPTVARLGKPWNGSEGGKRKHRGRWAKLSERQDGRQEGRPSVVEVQKCVLQENPKRKHQTEDWWVWVHDELVIKLWFIHHCPRVGFFWPRSFLWFQTCRWWLIKVKYREK